MSRVVIMDKEGNLKWARVEGKNLLEEVCKVKGVNPNGWKIVSKEK